MVVVMITLSKSYKRDDFRGSMNRELGEPLRKKLSARTEGKVGDKPHAYGAHLTL